MSIYVLYHGGGCFDGFAAAFAAWKKFGTTATYISVNYGEPIPVPLRADSEVYIVDFSYPREELVSLAHRMKKVVVLDHHKSAKEQLADLPGLVHEGHSNLIAHFDMEKSGATLAWEYFNGGDIPSLIRHVQDRDLWKFELPDTQAFTAALSVLPYDFDTWNDVYVWMQAGSLTDLQKKQTFLSQGRAILEYQNKLVRDQASEARWVEISHHKALAVNYMGPLRSEVGNLLLKECPEALFVITHGVLRDGTVKYSLRSREGFDTTQISKQFGGGGHAQASSFTTDLPVLKELT